MQGGGEFVAARRAAEALDAQVVLGDRPIEITLQQAWDSLSAGRKLELGWELARVALMQPSDVVGGRWLGHYLGAVPGPVLMTRHWLLG